MYFFALAPIQNLCKNSKSSFIGDYHPQWTLNGNVISFEGEKVSKCEEIPSVKLIGQTLSYATEMERIV